VFFFIPCRSLISSVTSGRVQIQHRRHHAGKELRVHDPLWIDHRRACPDTHGQRVPGPVQNLTTVGNRRKGPVLLVAGDVQILLVLDHLQHKKPQHDQKRPAQRYSPNPQNAPCGDLLDRLAHYLSRPRPARRGRRA
jgi:hypothetical protein